jgi:hypothetical protein
MTRLSSMTNSKGSRLSGSRRSRPFHSRWALRAVAGGLALAAGALAGPLAASAQSAQEILAQALEYHEARLANVDDVTVTQEIMGLPMTTYMVRETVDGRPILRPRTSEAAGFQTEMDFDAAEAFWANPWELYESAADRWILEGQGSVEGRATWSLRISDFEGLDLDLGIPEGSRTGTMEMQELAMELDRERLVPLRITFEGEAHDGTEVRPIAAELRFSDYREVQGYLHPFLTTMEMDLASSGISEGDLEEARAGMAEVQRQLEQLPEAQRQMMEGMFAEQIRAFEAMLDGESIELELRVLDLQVNSGPPST